MAIFRVCVQNQDRDLSALCLIYFNGILCGRFAFWGLVWDCVMKFSKKKKINIAGNPLMVRLRRCQWKAGTLRRHSYGNSLLSPAVAGGSDYVSTLIGYWCPINDTLTHTCTRALESMHVLYQDRGQNLSNKMYMSLFINYKETMSLT